MRDPRGAVSVSLLSLLVALEASDLASDGHAHGDVGPLGRLAGSLRDRVLDVVRPDEIVERLDVNAVLERVDVEEVLERIDVNALLERVDVDALLARIDLDSLIARVDVERVIKRAGIPEIVAESTSSVAERTLDLLRRQLLGLDVVATRAVMRVLSRDEQALPSGPAALVRIGDVTGHYAGPVTRLVAFVVDLFLAGVAFAVVSGGLGSALRTVGAAADGGTGRGVLLAAAVAWLFVYWWASTAVTGRTAGMALVGLRVVTRSGAPMSGHRALLRVLTLPLSVALVGVGLLVMLVDAERRALHDVIAGSAVVYDWGGRSATLPTPLARWLEQHDVTTGAAISSRAPGGGSAGGDPLR